MHLASAADRKKVIDILTASFDNNPSVNQVIRQDAKRKERIRGLMAYSFDNCLESGQVWINEAETACALVMFYDRKRTDLRGMLRDIQLIFRSIGISRVRYILKRDAAIRSAYPVSPFYYIWFIGVLPVAQGYGEGSRMLEVLLREAESMGRPVLLETSVPQNVSWYQRRGFRVYHTLQTGYDLYFLRYDRASPAEPSQNS